jgi:hypothetical protein
VSTRDETTLARTLYSTPLRTDDAGRVVPGLCTGWSASDDFRAWRFSRCRAAPAIAAELRRVARLRSSPANWIFAPARKISVPAPGVVLVRLPFPWRRFPYALTAVAAAPRGVPGPFALVRGSPNSVVLRRLGVTVVFRRLAPLAAIRAFRRGVVDEAPVPLGDVGNFRRRPLGQVLHVRPLLALDLLAFRPRAVPAAVRRAYWHTADRSDYQSLVAEDGATAALGLVGTPPRADPGAFRRAVDSIPSLPPVRVRVSVPSDPTLRYGARILYAQWREVGLGPRLVPAGAPAEADFLRVRAAYSQDEAVLGPLHLPADLGANEQGVAFDRLDEKLRASAAVVPICWVADARLVSARLAGWREDVLGDVDYTRVSTGP